jgi:acetoin utilization protein AcuB
MLVRERMSRPVISILPDTTMQEALDLMRKEHIRRLPVVDKRGYMVGIVTEADLDKASPSKATTLSVWEIRELVSKVRVEKIMTREVLTVDENTPIEEAARLMADNNISGLPVMDGDKLVGLITETDLFKIFLELFGARDAGVRLTLEVQRMPGQIAKIAQAVYEKGGDIVALGTYLGESADTGQIMLKVAGMEKDALIEVVHPFVLRILDSRTSEQR